MESGRLHAQRDRANRGQGPVMQARHGRSAGRRGPQPARPRDHQRKTRDLPTPPGCCRQDYFRATWAFAVPLVASLCFLAACGTLFSDVRAATPEVQATNNVRSIYHAAFRTGPSDCPWLR